MADRATKSLAHILESDEFVRVPDFVVFDEHDEFDENGKFLRRFDRARLQAIADKCNQRAENSGDLATIAPGHSIDTAQSEEDQPPPWGYAANYRLGHYGPGQKLGILCDAYVRKTIRTKDGRLVDGPEYIATFPRRSPELWPNHPAVPEQARNSFDWIAVLRRAPQRDLGLSVYHRNAAGQIIGGLTRFNKLRYQMETAMPNPVQEPNADDSADLDTQTPDGGQPEQPPEGHDEFANHLDYAMKHHPMLSSMCKKYGMDQAVPGATNAGLPGAGDGDADDNPALMQHSRRGQPNGADGDVRKTKYQLQLDAQEKRIKATESELAIERQRIRLQKYEMQLKDLSTEYVFDVAAEMEDVAGLDEKAFDKHLARIRKNYSRTPVGGDLPFDAHVEPSAATDAHLTDPAVGAKCLKYMSEHPELAQKYGDRAFHEAAKILKFTS